jgi:hypothetical protein
MCSITTPAASTDRSPARARRRIKHRRDRLTGDRRPTSQTRTTAIPSSGNASTSARSAAASVTNVVMDDAGAIGVKPRTPILLESATTIVRRDRSMMVAPTSHQLMGSG